MAVAGRRLPSRGSPPSVPAGDWDLRVPGLRVHRPRVARGCRTILRPGTTCGSSPARRTPRLSGPAHPARPQASGPEAIRLSGAGGGESRRNWIELCELASGVGRSPPAGPGVLFGALS